MQMPTYESNSRSVYNYLLPLIIIFSLARKLASVCDNVHYDENHRPVICFYTQVKIE